MSVVSAYQLIAAGEVLNADGNLQYRKLNNKNDVIGTALALRAFAVYAVGADGKSELVKSDNDTWQLTPGTYTIHAPLCFNTGWSNKVVLQALNSRFSPDELQVVASNVDTNRDGRVSFKIRVFENVKFGTSTVIGELNALVMPTVQVTRTYDSTEAAFAISGDYV